MVSYNELFRDLETASSDKTVSPDRLALLFKRLEAVLNYEPRIGVFGATGAGKSSLCNAVFGAKVAETSDVAACTRKIQEIFVQIGAAGVKLYDFPGVGESKARDEEYHRLYIEQIPKLDLVLWLSRSDVRLGTDEEFFKQVVLPRLNDKPLFVVLSQAEKVEPFGSWDDEHRAPGAKQQHNLNTKAEEISSFFNLSMVKVIPVSAHKEYNLVHLVNKIVFALPKEQKFTFAKSVKEERRSEEAKKEAEEGFFEVIGEIVGEIFGRGNIGKGIGKAVDKLFRGMFSDWW